jgi:inorganic pyrophosphatase
MRIWDLLAIALLPCALATQRSGPPPNVLPAQASSQLVLSLEAASRHKAHVWRDTPPTNPDGTVNGYIEIARGDRNKWEFDMGANGRALDRVMSERIGGYPVNYGFVPQTVSYDGDPFDILVLGPPLRGGEAVRGVVVGLLHMEDEKGLDSKVVVAPRDENGNPRHRLESPVRDQIAEYFAKYKIGEAGKFSKVYGWGSVEEGLQFIATTHAFFEQCRARPAVACTVRLTSAGP